MMVWYTCGRIITGIFSGTLTLNIKEMHGIMPNRLLLHLQEMYHSESVEQGGEVSCEASPRPFGVSYLCPKNLLAETKISPPLSKKKDFERWFCKKPQDPLVSYETISSGMFGAFIWLILCLYWRQASRSNQYQWRIVGLSWLQFGTRFLSSKPRFKPKFYIIQRSLQTITFDLYGCVSILKALASLYVYLYIYVTFLLRMIVSEHAGREIRILKHLFFFRILHPVPHLSRLKTRATIFRCRNGQRQIQDQYNPKWGAFILAPWQQSQGS